MGWKNPGYHYIIEENGNVVQLLDTEKVSNGVAGHNSYSIHISTIGGINKDGRPFDNRTAAQRTSQLYLISKLKAKYPKAKIVGHRDFAGVKKACPSYDVATWLKQINFQK
jgi:N-acetylmuramoyl-L-alanine amidase